MWSDCALLGPAEDTFDQASAKFSAHFASAMGQALNGMNDKTPAAAGGHGGIDFERPRGQEQLCKATFSLNDIPLTMNASRAPGSHTRQYDPAAGAKRSAPASAPLFTQVQCLEKGASAGQTTRQMKHREVEQRRRDKLSVR